jgi:hypothetical protein
MTCRFASLFAVLTVGLLSAAPAYAAKGNAAKTDAKSDTAKSDAAKSDPAPAADDTKADDAKPSGDADADKSDDAAAAKDDKGEKEVKLLPEADGSSAVEDPNKTYRFIGLRYRGIVVPKFMINLFGQGGRTVFVNGFGPEFAVRRGGFEYDFSAWYAAYSMDDTPFKASSDPPEAWEIVNSRIKVLFLTADFLWSHDVAPQFAINYGLGAGFGLVWGDLFRTQAYPGPGGDPSNGDGFQKCLVPGQPGTGAYCGTDNAHYPGYTEPSWANGGSKPIIFPWFVLQTGARYKASKEFVARLDLGFGTSGFFFGLGADYGL